jgi:hypothetical protein
VSYIGEIPHGAAQAVEAGHNEGVALSQNREHLLQLGPPLALGAAGLLLEDDAYASPPQSLALHGQILVGSRHPGIADQLP